VVTRALRGRGRGRAESWRGGESLMCISGDGGDGMCWEEEREGI
jgi:hypothetical protein